MKYCWEGIWASSSSSVTAYITRGKSIYYHLSEPSSYQNSLILSYGSLHTLFSVSRCNFYMFSEGLRPCIFSKMCSLQTESNLNICYQNHVKYYPILPAVTKLWGSSNLSSIFSFLIDSYQFTYIPLKYILNCIIVHHIHSCHCNQNH